MINLTIPDAHYGVTLTALEAGKHVYSEKPFVLTVDEGKRLKELADAKGLRVGSAPDTFLGGAHQLARKLIDDGSVGTVTSGTAHVMSHGMEHWHPNPGFFFLPGAGPMLDVGPYYVANLINLIGPVRRVAALANSATPTRTVTAEGPLQGPDHPGEDPDHHPRAPRVRERRGGHPRRELGRLGPRPPADGALRHRRRALRARPELVRRHGRAGGPRRQGERGADVGPSLRQVPNDDRPNGSYANYRTAGLADMAVAILEGREARCALERALHGIDVMTSILKSGETGAFVDLTTTCTRPEPLGPEAARALLV